MKGARLPNRTARLLVQMDPPGLPVRSGALLVHVTDVIEDGQSSSAESQVSPECSYTSDHFRRVASALILIL